MSTLEAIDRKISPKSVEVLLFPPKGGGHGHIPQRSATPYCDGARNDYQSVRIEHVRIKNRRADGVSIAIAGQTRSYRLCPVCFEHADVDLPPRFEGVLP